MDETQPVAGETEQRGRRRGGESGSWVLGVILIILGVAFLLQQAGYLALSGNWWAVFIYLASFGSFANAWRSYRAGGQFGSAATGSLIWGLVLLVVATILLFELSWDLWWPVILVAVGAGIVIGHLLRTVTKTPEEPVA